MSQRGIQKLFIFCSLLKGFYDLLFLNLCRWLMWIKYNLWDTLLEIISNRQKWVHLKEFIGTWQKTIESWTRKCHHALIFCHNLFIMNRLLVVVASVLVRALPSLTPMLKNKLFRLYRMIQSTFIAGFWGNAQLADNASGIIYIVDL